MIASAPAKLFEGKRGLIIGNRPRCFRAGQWQTWRRDAAALALWEKTTRMQGHTGSATRGHAGSHRHRIHRMCWSRRTGSSASMRLNPTGDVGAILKTVRGGEARDTGISSKS